MDLSLQTLILTWLSGHWVDVLSIMTGACYLPYVRAGTTTPAKWISQDTCKDFVNGMALAPLLLLFFGAFSEWIMKSLLEASALTLAAASVFALAALLERR